MSNPNDQVIDMKSSRFLSEEKREKISQAVREKALPVLDVVFLMLSGIYLLYLTEQSTMFYLPIPAWFEQTLLIVMAVFALFRILLIGGYRKKVWIGLALGAVYSMVYRSDKYSFLLFLAVLTIGFIDIDYRKILKMYLLTVGVFFVVTVIAALSGAVPNLVYLDSVDKSIRSSWGICYPTDFASYVVFLIMALWITHKKMPDWIMLLMAAGSAVVARYIANSETSFYCSILLMLIVLYHGFYQHVVLKRQKVRWLDKGVNGVLVSAFLVFAICIFALVYLYMNGNSFASRINSWMSDRFYYTSRIYSQYGIKAFGSPFQQLGNGFSTFSTNTYQFVDSSYPLILIRYGYVMFASTVLLWCISTGKAIKRGDKRMALAMALIAFHAISEHHFPEVNYNILLIMPLAAFGQNAEQEVERNKTGRKIAAVLSMFALAAGGLMLLPRGLSSLKTVFILKHLTGGREHGWMVIAAITVAIIAVSVFAVCIYLLVRGGTAKKWKKVVVALGAVCAVVMMAIGYTGCGRVINQAYPAQQSVLDEEEQALDIVTRSATGKVTADDIPEIYIRKFPGISRSVLAGEDVARLPGSTVIMRADDESNVLLSKGFRYLQISDEHSIYTSDQAVIDALAANGYQVLTYYNNVVDVSLAQEAARNGLPYDVEKGILLNGPKQSLKHGPYLGLYSSKYTVTFELALPEGAPREDKQLCTLRVSVYSGQRVLKEEAVYGTQFDNEGKLKVTLQFSAWNWPGIEFLALAQDDCQLYVQRITYQKTP